MTKILKAGAMAGVLVAVAAACAMAQTAAPADPGSAPEKPRRPRAEQGQQAPEAARQLPEWRQRLRVFFQEQARKNRAFFARVRNLPPEERREAIRKHREEMRARTDQVLKRVRGAQIGQLKERLAKMPNLTDENRAEILKFVEQQWRMGMAFRDEMLAANQTAAKRILDNPDLSPGQRRAAFREQAEQNRAKRREQIEKLQGERKQFRERMQQKIQEQKPDAPAES